MNKLLYIHGYNSSSTSGSCKLFYDYLTDKGWDVIGIEYDESNCAKAIDQIRKSILDNNIDMVAGSSLGGFLALLTTGIKRIVINPCYQPSVELPKIRKYSKELCLPVPSIKMIATYKRFEANLKGLSNDEKGMIYGYFSDRDELLGDRYHCAFRDDIHDFRIIPGGHHLNESAVQIICEDILSHRI